MAAQEDTARIASIDFGELFVGANEFRVCVENPEEQPLTVSLRVTFGADAPSVSVLESDEALIDHRLPYSISGRETATVHLECDVETAGDAAETLARRSRREQVVPFQREVMAVTRALDGLTAMVPVLPEPEAFQERIDAFRFRLPQLRERATMATAMNLEELRSLTADMTALRTATGELHELLSAVTGATGGDVPRVLLSAANPWAPFGGMAEITEGPRARSGASGSRVLRGA